MDEDLALQVAGLHATAAGINGDLPLKRAGLDAAAAGTQADVSAGFLNDDATPAVLQIYIAGLWHGDLELHASQTKLEKVPGDIRGDIHRVATLVVHHLHFLSIDTD